MKPREREKKRRKTEKIRLVDKAFAITLRTVRG
jgi:hypothetical protein